MQTILTVEKSNRHISPHQFEQRLELIILVPIRIDEPIDGIIPDVRRQAQQRSDDFVGIEKDALDVAPLCKFGLPLCKEEVSDSLEQFPFEQGLLFWFDPGQHLGDCVVSFCFVHVHQV